MKELPIFSSRNFIRESPPLRIVKVQSVYFRGDGSALSESSIILQKTTKKET